MRIGIVTSGGGLEHLYLKNLMLNEKITVDWIACVNSKLGKKTYWDTLTWFIRNAGIKLLFYKIILSLRIKYGVGASSIKENKQNLKFDKVQFEKLSSFNESSIINFVDTFQSDAVIALNLYSIVPTAVLKSAKLGFINIHFGALPSFRGMSPFLWSLAKGQERLTSTVHLMSDGIDEGPILDEIIVPAHTSKSVMKILLDGHHKTAQELPELLEKYFNGEIIPKQQPEEGTYFGIAGRSCIKEIKSHGYRLWSMTDLLFWKDE